MLQTALFPASYSMHIFTHNCTCMIKRCFCLPVSSTRSVFWSHAEVSLSCHATPVSELKQQATVFQRADNFIQRITCIGWSTFYPLDRVIRSLNNRDQDGREKRTKKCPAWQLPFSVFWRNFAFKSPTSGSLRYQHTASGRQTVWKWVRH